MRDPKKLYAYIKERLLPDQMNYIFLDEIQQCEDFPRVVDSLYIKNNVDLYVTGSNANMLSSEIATLLSGRYVEIKMLPLSFKEYVESTGNENDLQRKYTTYLENSSFPYALELAGHPKEIRDYLDGIYNTIIVKDIAQRHKITDTMMLESVTRFIFDNIGNQLSTKKIADTMTSDGRKIDVRAVEKYLAAFMESYVIYQAKDIISRKTIFKNIGEILCCRYWIKIYVIRKQINGCWAYIGKCYIFGINSKRI